MYESIISRYPSIASVRTAWMGRGMFEAEYVVITARNGNQYYYRFWYCGTWDSKASWVNAACLEFENEYDEKDDNYGMGDQYLFAVVDTETDNLLRDEK